jgi:hypothetical protein
MLKSGTILSKNLNITIFGIDIFKISNINFYRI